LRHTTVQVTTHCAVCAGRSVSKELPAAFTLGGGEQVIPGDPLVDVAHGDG
jgi:hypothetical protein